MWEEVYYKELDENDGGKGRSILPYSVKCKDMEELDGFIHYLDEMGFVCVEKIEGQKALLVNLKLKRWCTYPKPCTMECKNGRTYTVAEFKAIAFS